MNSQKRHYLRVFVRVRVCEQRTVGMSGGAAAAAAGGGYCKEREGYRESICSIHSLRNRSRILPACVATCQNLSS